MRGGEAPSTQSGRGRRLLGAAAAVFVLLATLAGGAVWVGWRFHTDPGPLSEPLTMVVPRGAGVAVIAELLAEKGVIEQPLVFRASARIQDLPLKAGEYRFEPGISQRNVMLKMFKGEVVVRRLTVPEGLTAFEILALLDATEGLEDKVAESPPEGTLLPETYHFSWGDGRPEIVDRMRAGMSRTLDELWEGRQPNLPLAGKEQALVLASIVERETGIDRERPHVAAVFLNRLRKGIKLQSDPTVIYGLSDRTGRLDRALTKDDLARPNPWNTYLIDGLPPSPIANPGRAAINAVLHPAASDDLFFVADGTGGHAFAKTLADHNRNVAKWRKIEKARKTGE